MYTKDVLIVTIDQSIYNSAELSKRAAIPAATSSLDQNVQAWFKQNGHEASTRTLPNIGYVFISCDLAAADVFEKAVADKKVPGVTSALRNEYVTFEPDDGDSATAEGSWAEKTKRRDFGID